MAAALSWRPRRARKDRPLGIARVMFVEEPINCQEHDVMAEIARGTFLPIATGERVFTKWGFREVLEKRAVCQFQNAARSHSAWVKFHANRGGRACGKKVGFD